MKKIVMLMISVMCMTTMINAQDTWQVLLNNLVIAKGTVVEGQEVVIKKRFIKKTDKLLIRYNTENSSADWYRNFFIEGPDATEIKTINLKRQSGSFRLTPSFINGIMKQKIPLNVYTVTMPSDPALAATARSRKVLLVNVRWR